MSFCKSNVPLNTPSIILVSKTLYERYKFIFLLVKEIRKQVTLNECQLNILYSIFYCNVAKRLENEIYNTCALSKHMGNMCMRLRNAGKGEASPRLFPRFAPNTHIYLYASTVHMYCIYPAILNRK